MNNIFNRNKFFLLLATLLACAIIFTELNCSPKDKAKLKEEIYLNHNDSVKYVGMNTCKGCHNDIHANFIHTGMGQSFGLANASKTSAKFNGHNVIYDPFLNLYYQPILKNKDIFILEYRLEGKDTVHKRLEKVSYIVGSGMHTNSHMSQTNGYIFQMPLTYYTQKGQWDLPPGFEKGHNSRFSRSIELECMSCHNAYPNIMPGSKNKFVSIPQGIDCERCHGPGSIHVREKQLGHLVDTSTMIDYTIVNPKKLPYDLQVDVCQRCHLQGDAVLAEGKSFFDFKPGQKLSDYINVFLPRYKGDNQTFIMASHADRLKQSKCFIESTRLKINTVNKKYSNSKLSNQNVSSLTCISCHNPHVSIRNTANAQFNNACKNCHGNKQYPQLSDCKEKIAVRKITNDNCWSCHMPKSGTEDIPHVTVHDHRIQIPVRKNAVKAIQQFIGLAAVNNPKPNAHTIGEGYLSYYEKFKNNPSLLDSASYYFAQPGSYSEKHLFNNLIRLAFLKQDFNSLVKMAEKKQITYSNDPWTLYRIGEAYSNLNIPKKAVIFYQLACNEGPYYLEFQNKLGSTSLQLGDVATAKKCFEFIIQENPKFAPALSNMGYINAMNHNFSSAMDLYNRAIALDPDYEQALVNKSALLINLNKKQEAILLMRKILKINPNNNLIKQAISEIQSPAK